jgi:hemerythrin-like domain-containing protein
MNSDAERPLEDDSNVVNRPKTPALSSMKATHRLKEDHGQILRALDVLEEMAARVRRKQSIEQEDTLALVAFLKGYADRHHQGQEEAVLFPALLRDTDQKHYGKLCRMIFEHNRERSLVAGLEEAIRSRKTQDFVYCAGQLVDNLRSHILEEDPFLFELVETTLSPDEDARVALEMENFDRLWRQQALPDLLRRLDKMQSEYIGGVRARPASGN